MTSKNSRNKSRSNGRRTAHPYCASSRSVARKTTIGRSSRLMKTKLDNSEPRGRRVCLARPQLTSLHERGAVKTKGLHHSSPSFQGKGLLHRRLSISTWQAIEKEDPDIPLTSLLTLQQLQVGATRETRPAMGLHIHGRQEGSQADIVSAQHSKFQRRLPADR